MKLKKDDYFIDVSSYQSADLTAICQAAGTRKTIIKVSEGTGYLSPNRFTQTQTSEPIGYYHFAQFGGNVSQAVAEANFFISNLPAKVPYLVCDYEDGASGDKQANTNAVLAFMDRCAQAGYKPIYYSDKPYTLNNIDYQQILAKYPNSLWIAAYPNYNVTPNPVWSIFPSMDGIRWWQFTSTGIAGGLDKNVVLLDDDDTIQSNDLKGEETMDFLFNIKGDPNWNEGTLYFYNGHTNEIRPLKHIDEMKILQQIYKDNNGRDLPSYTWTNQAPWYVRFFAAVNPDSTSAQIQEAIKVTKEQAKATTEAITKEVKAAAETTNAEVKAAKDAPQKVEVTIKNN
ncbi:hypothetical protein Si129_00177 [Streptococcus infantarius subsp. infantarius]|nr:hypothetical protein [Streptococcus infantarius subsp. infantarius]MCO4479504.1 hypothetical protein [Streptococcus infantarius subsp. infantarius]